MRVGHFAGRPWVAPVGPSCGPGLRHPPPPPHPHPQQISQGIQVSLSSFGFTLLPGQTSGSQRQGAGVCLLQKEFQQGNRSFHFTTWITQTVIHCYQLSDQVSITLQAKAHVVRAVATSKAFESPWIKFFQPVI